ncbi:MAG: hypothetical protein CFE28_04965 [Alphaproteobacteria bacterium PA2]|nr:MAG: hypothetical protein CFE28_04965 [Alphaproteobacteria bacterium PA2]
MVQDKETDEDNDETVELVRSINLDPNRLCTHALYRFVHDYRETVRFFFFTVTLATRSDKMRLIASKALAEVGAKPEHIEVYDEVQANPSPVFDQLKKYGSIQSQNLVLRATNAFLLYYSEIIQAAIFKRPEILKSKQTIRWDELLGFTRFDDVVRYLIDKKVNELSYAGLGQMEEFMFERLGLAGSITDEQRALTAILVEIRNIYTHNRGVVNGIFLARVENHMGFHFVDGKYFHVDLDMFSRLSGNCLEVAYAIDEAVAKKFGLKRKRYVAWRGPKKKGGS